MPKFSQRSLDRLATCHEDLQVLAHTIIEERDCTIIEGARSDERQFQLCNEGKSEFDGINKKSKHQVTKEKPKSRAVDIGPYPLDWNDLNIFYHFVGYVKATADRLFKEGKMKHRIRCGADWDGDYSFKDQKFHDLPHFELIENEND